MDTFKTTSKDFEKEIVSTLARYFGLKQEEATKQQIYQAVCIVVREKLTQARSNFKKTVREKNGKIIYYMSMEFLLGRSLKNHIFNMGIMNEVEAAVKSLGFDMNEIYELEPDAGLGNGGLGRLAAAYMDSLGKAASMEIGNLSDLEQALEKRMLAFHELGCRVSDHGLERMVYTPVSRNKAEEILKKGL